MDSDTSKQKIEGLAEPYEVKERITCSVKEIKIEEGITALAVSNLFGNVSRTKMLRKLSFLYGLSRKN